jgi:hypothetical protein
VLVQARRREAHRRALAVEPQRRRRQRVAAGLHDRLHPQLLREPEGLRDVVDRPGRHARGAQRPHPLVGAAGREDRREQLGQRVGVRHARGVGREALVGGEAGEPECVAQPREQAVVADATASGRSAAS